MIARCCYAIFVGVVDFPRHGAPRSFYEGLLRSLCTRVGIAHNGQKHAELRANWPAGGIGFASGLLRSWTVPVARTDCNAVRLGQSLRKISSRHAHTYPRAFSNLSSLRVLCLSNPAVTSMSGNDRANLSSRIHDFILGR